MNYFIHFKSLLFFNREDGIKIRDLDGRNILPPAKEERIVSILAYCLMPNHYHLLVREKKENGITSFMRKLGTGYTMYFNTKYERNGVLFQGKFKSVLVSEDSYSHYIPHYIHVNPLDLVMNWREDEVDYRKAKTFLDSYKWSSYHYYLNSVDDLILDTGSVNDLYDLDLYRANFTDWLKSIELENIKDLVLE